MYLPNSLITKICKVVHTTSVYRWDNWGPEAKQDRSVSNLNVHHHLVPHRLPRKQRPEAGSITGPHLAGSQSPCLPNMLLPEGCHLHGKERPSSIGVYRLEPPQDYKPLPREAVCYRQERPMGLKESAEEDKWNTGISSVTNTQQWQSMKFLEAA